MAGNNDKTFTAQARLDRLRMTESKSKPDAREVSRLADLVNRLGMKQIGTVTTTPAPPRPTSPTFRPSRHTTPSSSRGGSVSFKLDKPAQGAHPVPDQADANPNKVPDVTETVVINSTRVLDRPQRNSGGNRPGRGRRRTLSQRNRPLMMAHVAPVSHEDIVPDGVIAQQVGGATLGAVIERWYNGEPWMRGGVGNPDQCTSYEWHNWLLRQQALTRNPDADVNFGAVARVATEMEASLEAVGYYTGAEGGNILPISPGCPSRLRGTSPGVHKADCYTITSPKLVYALRQVLISQSIKTVLDSRLVLSHTLGKDLTISEFFSLWIGFLHRFCPDAPSLVSLLTEVGRLRAPVPDVEPCEGCQENIAWTTSMPRCYIQHRRESSCRLPRLLERMGFVYNDCQYLPPPSMAWGTLALRNDNVDARSAVSSRADSDSEDSE